MISTQSELPSCTQSNLQIITTFCNFSSFIKFDFVRLHFFFFCRIYSFLSVIQFEKKFPAPSPQTALVCQFDDVHSSLLEQAEGNISARDLRSSTPSSSDGANQSVTNRELIKGWILLSWGPATNDWWSLPIQSLLKQYRRPSKFRRGEYNLLQLQCWWRSKPGLISVLSITQYISLIHIKRSTILQHLVWPASDGPRQNIRDVIQECFKTVTNKQ